MNRLTSFAPTPPSSPIGRARCMARIHALLLCAFLASVAGSAYAEDAPHAATTDELASQAYTAYTAGKFSDAIGLYTKIYQISQSAAALLNVATIYDHNLHERQAAVEYYRRYLRAPDADSDRVKKVNDRLIALNRESEESPQPAPVPQASAPGPVAQQAVAPKPAATELSASSREQPASHGLRTAGLFAGAVGIVSLGTSGVLSIVAHKKNSDADAFCNGKVCSDARGVDLAHQAGDAATAATVTFVGGLALLATGVVLYVVPSGSSDSPRSATLSVAPAVGPTASGISVFGRF